MQRIKAHAILPVMLSQVRYARLPTEQSHPRTRALERFTPEQLAGLMASEERRVARAVQTQRRAIGRAIRLITDILSRGGRLWFVGAGTSGRLGVLEAAECPPTFGTPPALVQAIIAGGRAAVFRSREGAEDDRAAARRIVRARVRRGDAVVGIAASGVTPFVVEAVRSARQRGVRTIFVTCHPRAPRLAEVTIALSVGPEVLTGSTRLKAGSATKLVLNCLTLGAMVRLGKTHGHLMVDVRPTSRKLRARALRIIRTFTGGSEPQAARALLAARGRTKVAILMARRGLTYRQAAQRLTVVHGSLQRALTGR